MCRNDQFLPGQMRQWSAVIFAVLVAQFSSATTVQFQTVMGEFDVNLYDQATPNTVANFLAYVEGEDYSDNIMHRSVPGFVIQGGGFSYQSSDPNITTVTSRGPLANEPVYSNLRGTIAMAKLGGRPDSATSQWFINLSNNSATLDPQNGGFTVFGEVMGDGMAVVDAIAALSRFNLGGAFEEAPLRDFTAENAANGIAITEENYVLVRSIVVLDASQDTAANLTPAENTLVDTPSGGSQNPTTPAASNDSGGGGGSVNFGFLLVMLGLIVIRRGIFTYNK